MEEIWKPIPGHSNYEASSYGNIRSKDFMCWNGHVWFLKKGRIIKPAPNRKGYYTVSVNGDNYKGCRTKTVHRLVCMAFLKNVHNLPAINHKDEDRSNNHVENLEWCTNHYNDNYGTRNEKVRKALLDSNKTGKKVGMFDKSGNLICKFRRISEAARLTGCSDDYISCRCRGKVKNQGDFIWKYLE